MAETKGERTRQRLIEAAAPVFNQRGYWGASVSDVMSAAGLEKGGIYNHFASKDELALAAFEHNTGVVGALVRQGLEGKRHAIERLVALIEVYRDFAHHPPFPGGCPVLNTAVEADDTHVALRDSARATLTLLREGTVARIVERGIERGEIADDVDPLAVGTVLVAGIEGALMLNQVYDDPAHLDHMADHLLTYVQSLAASPAVTASTRSEDPTS
jgi:TetR/AcrR family transcriptional regulator, transcriptional repressor for nem operon